MSKFSMKNWKRQQAQENRPIIAWDGEGINIMNGDGLTFQTYSMLSNSLGERMIAPAGESLERYSIIDWMMDVERRFPTAIHVIYGGNYDFNMIIRGNRRPKQYNLDEMEELKETEECRVGEYRVKVLWGRTLEITGKGLSFTLFDVMPFFQTSFVNACDDYLGTDWPGRDNIIKMKKERQTFSYEEMDAINEYNDYELETLVLLVQELRKRLFAAGLRITKWYGPGAIAAYIYKQQGIKHCMDQSHAIDDPEFGHAVRAAYAGGRFEVIKTGYNVSDPVYEYDINSAYPYAMTKLPDLASGTWETVNGDPGYHHFALYHIKYQAEDGFIGNGWNTPFPLYYRNPQSLIFFPAEVSGWFWSPEYKMAKEFVAKHGGSIIIDSAYVYHENGERPFQFVKDMYDERQRLKREGSGAQIGLKLGLNSLYGKMAQQIGWTEERQPPFHQLEWAGYVTSHCRAQIMTAVMDKLDSVVGFATDAVFLTEKIEVSITSELGDWEQIRFDNMSMLQSGIYFGNVDGKFVLRTRGVRPEDFDVDLILSNLRKGIATLESTSVRFVTLGAALARKYMMWCSWIEQTATIALLLTSDSKRVHARASVEYTPWKRFLVCSACNPEIEGWAEGIWHDTYVPLMEVEENKEHQVDWIVKDEIVEWITTEREYDYQEIEI